MTFKVVQLLNQVSKAILNWSSNLTRVSFQKTITTLGKKPSLIQTQPPTQINLQHEASIILHLNDIKDREHTY